MNLTAYDTETVFDDLKDEWNDLLRRSNCDQIFSTWEWQSTWWREYQAGDLWIVAARNDDGRLVGLAPWFVETSAEGERVVRFIGCVDVTDYVDVIIEPQQTEAVFTALAEHLLDHADRYDRVNLCNIPETSPTHQAFAAVLKQAGFEVDVPVQEVCPVIPLPRTFEDYLNTLDKKQRHEIRRKIRRAEAEPGLGWYIVGPEHDLEAETERFLKLMASSHPSKAEFLTNPKNESFFRAIVRTAYERGWLQLAFLNVGPEVAAAYVNFDYAGRILVYNSGLQPEAFGQLSAGIVLLAYLIEHAIETGRFVFDFLRGNETYKYRMGAQDTRVYKLKAQLN